MFSSQSTSSFTCCSARPTVWWRHAPEAFRDVRANQVLQAKMDSSSVLAFFINTYPVHLSLKPQSLQLKFNQNSIFLSLGLLFFFHILSLVGHQMNENHPSRGRDMAILCVQLTKGICTFTRRLFSVP